MNIYAIIVIYNINLEDSPSLISLLKYQEYNPIEIILCDNSDEINSNTDNTILKQNIKYISMKGNMGLSYAYNKAISEIKKLSSDSCIFFLDQDTVVNFELFDKGQLTLKDNKLLNIIAPQVNDVQGLLSPCKMTYTGGKRINKYKKITKNISFINSGLCIRANVFKNIKYDEDLFLDLVDISFINKYKENFNLNTIEVSDVIIQQEFSGTSHVGLSNKLTRFVIYIKDFRTFYNKEILMKIICEISLFIYSLKLSIKYGNNIFLKKLYSKE